MMLLRSPVSLAFVSVHVACLAAIHTGITKQAVAIGFALYWLRIFSIGAGYHRYFAHRSFKTSRFVQFCLALASQTSAQRGILWWAAKHRQHHWQSDAEHDVHSPVRRGFLYAHVGWLFTPDNDKTDYEAVRDLACYPELCWLDRHIHMPAAVLATIVWCIAGWPGLVVGFCWSTVAVWHVTFSVNSIGHTIGHQSYVTGDASRNNWLLAIFTMGEGWHNNHHIYPASVRQGFLWWEYDATYYLLRSLSCLGIVWDLHTPPAAVVNGQQRLGRNVIDKVALQLATSLPVDAIADQVQIALVRTADWVELRRRARSARQLAEEYLEDIHLPFIPPIEDFRRYAERQLARTPSVEQIANRTRQHLVELVSARLIDKAMN